MEAFIPRDELVSEGELRRDAARGGHAEHERNFLRSLWVLGKILQADVPVTANSAVNWHAQKGGDALF